MFVSFYNIQAKHKNIVFINLMQKILDHYLKFNEKS